MQMRAWIAAALAAGALGSTASVASAAPPPGIGFHGQGGAVFVQNDNPAANAVAVYDRSPGGALSLAGTYPTGGDGGALAGAVVDDLASQGSLDYDSAAQLLFAVNAGSDSVSVFAVHGDALTLTQVIGSGGSFPVSIAVHGSTVYVLNALGGGSVQGYRLLFDRLVPMPWSERSLGLDPTASPQYTNTPGQVAFSPDGRQLIVTTKMNGDDVDVFGVDASGRLSAGPVVNAEPGTVPFGVTFDQAGQLILTEAGPDAVASFWLAPSGTLAPIATVPTGQGATCWVVADGSLLFASNAGGPTLTTLVASPFGGLEALGDTDTDPGTVDAVVTPDGRFLYVQTGLHGIVDEFQVGPGGTLTEIGSVVVTGAVAGEGIAAS